jgi:hypothetical protein
MTHTTGAIYELGVSPPGSLFKGISFPTGGAWSSEQLQIIQELAVGSPDECGRVALKLPAESDEARTLLAAFERTNACPILDYQLLQNPGIADVHAVPMYSAKARIQSEGFSALNIFEDQTSCGLPKQAPLLGHTAGCGLRKKQLYKLQITNPSRIKDGDVIEPHIAPFVLHWQTLVVSARFRETLLASDLSGFEFLPIAGPNASFDELRLTGEKAESDSQDWFQWVITGRTRPIPIQEFTPLRGACARCGASSGFAQPYYLSQPLDLNHFSGGGDIQVNEVLELPDGSVVMSTDGHLFASSRFVEVCLRRKFKGLTGLAGRAACFSALYFGPNAT